MVFKPEEFENTGLLSSVDRKHFENRAFQRKSNHNDHMISLHKSFSKTNPKWP